MGVIRDRKIWTLERKDTGIRQVVTQNSNTKIFTHFANPESQIRARKDTTPISVHNINSFNESEPSDVEYKEIGEVDIETLSMEQYLALDRGDTMRGVKKLEIGGYVDFEIKGLTATTALVTIQEMADHSYKWHDKERTGEYNSNRISTITDKHKSLNHDTQNLKENVHAIKGRYESSDEMNYLSSKEVKFVKATKYREDSLGVTPGNNSPSRNSSKLKETLGKYLEESCKRKDMFDEWMERFRDNTDKNLRRHATAIKGLKENVCGWLKQ
ncbi:hypothetical protein Tco_1041073 [Tanacetum coccineum]|uniref:Uncharacterized protein n=1 Tax=Tanacetum coccineum TaxID=301880 RepID=A0ABQ5GHR7_9ASTR